MALVELKRLARLFEAKEGEVEVSLLSSVHRQRLAPSHPFLSEQQRTFKFILLRENPLSAVQHSSPLTSIARGLEVTLIGSPSAFVRSSLRARPSSFSSWASVLKRFEESLVCILERETKRGKKEGEEREVRLRSSSLPRNPSASKAVFLRDRICRRSSIARVLR